MPPVSPYRFAGAALAQAQGKFDPQRNNNGMLEFNINGIVPGGKEILLLSIQEFQIPGRSVGVANLAYLNGKVKYATAPTELGNVTATFRDFPLAGTRRILEQWFALVYDESTGLQLPMAAVKTTAHVVLFQGDGTQERVVRLEGVFPVKKPDIAINYTGDGSALLMQCEFSIDRVIPTGSLLNPVPG